MATSSRRKVTWIAEDGRDLRALPLRVASIYLFGGLPLLLVAGVLLGGVAPGSSLGTDFHQAFWPAGRAVLEGRTPYPRLDPGLLAHGTSFVYPPIVALAVAPLALLPQSVATVLAILVTAGAVVATLRVLGVADWRCYGITFASPTVLVGIQTAALSALLALAVAIAWRHRTRGPVALILVALAIAAKLFLWPLLIWLVVVRGVRAAGVAAAAATAAVLLPWVLGFPGFAQYPHLLQMLTATEGDHAYTMRALALSFGAGSGVAELVAVAVGGGVLVLALVCSRMPDAERRTLALTLLGALLLSPLVWSHYLVVLLPVVAIGRPRLGWAWLAPLALWSSGGTWDAPSAGRIALGLAAMVLVAITGLVPVSGGAGPGRRLKAAEFRHAFGTRRRAVRG